MFAIDLYLLNFAVFQITNIYFLKMRNAVSNKGEPRKILGGKNLTVARATFATVWIRAWILSFLSFFHACIEEKKDVLLLCA